MRITSAVYRKGVNIWVKTYLILDKEEREKLSGIKLLGENVYEAWGKGDNPVVNKGERVRERTDSFGLGEYGSVPSGCELVAGFINNSSEKIREEFIEAVQTADVIDEIVRSFNQ